MCFNSKEQKLAAIIIISFIAINVFSVIYMFSRPVTDPPYVRPPASHHNINIMHGGGTEDLGYIDDDNISLHWIVWVTDTHLDGSLNGTLFKIYGQFLNYTYSSIHPFFTVNTGDLAGAQTRNYYIAIPQDFKALLKEYNSTVNHSLYNSDPNPLRYIDLAGNHDRNLDWGAQYFLNTTFTASRFHSIQHFISANFSAGETIYSFLDTAATLEAPAVPFGAEGSLDKDDFREYVAFLEAHKGAVNKLTFQHHYPWDTFGLAKDPHNHFYWDENYYNEKYGIDALFYGHFHFEGFENYRNVPYVLGDRWVHEMKDDLTGSDKEYPYVFHLISVDGQNINYHEVALDLQPHIIITNPGNPYFLDHADSITNTRGDGQVRTLVFANSSWSIISVEYQIDNGGWHAMKRYMGSKYLWESDRGTPS
ncbi:MAG: metallophosphoesterase family protein, partial [Promethearchaeota archaeon]